MPPAESPRHAAWSRPQVAEPPLAEPTRAEPTRAEPTRAEPQPAEPQPAQSTPFASAPSASDRNNAPPSAPDSYRTAPLDRVDADPISTRVHAAPTPAERTEATEAIETVVLDRRARADRATRGVLAALLCLEALVVLLLPRAIAQTSTGLDATKTILLIVLAVVLVATGFLLRRPWGIGLGSALQLAVLATGVLEPVMVAVAVVFIALWLWVLTMRRDLVGTLGGWRMLVS